MCYLTDGAQREIARYDALSEDSSRCSMCLSETPVSWLLKVPEFGDSFCPDCVSGLDLTVLLNMYRQSCGEDLTLADEYLIFNAFKQHYQPGRACYVLADAKAFYDQLNEDLYDKIIRHKKQLKPF